MKNKTISRITLLTTQEVNELYARPSFNQAERKEFFSLGTEMNAF